MSQCLFAPTVAASSSLPRSAVIWAFVFVYALTFRLCWLFLVSEQFPLCLLDAITPLLHQWRRLLCVAFAKMHCFLVTIRFACFLDRNCVCVCVYVFSCCWCWCIPMAPENGSLCRRTQWINAKYKMCSTHSVLFWLLIDWYMCVCVLVLILFVDLWSGQFAAIHRRRRRKKTLPASIPYFLSLAAKRVQPTSAKNARALASQHSQELESCFTGRGTHKIVEFALCACCRDDEQYITCCCRLVCRLFCIPDVFRSVYLAFARSFSASNTTHEYGVELWYRASARSFS